MEKRTVYISINMCNSGSTGRIAENLALVAMEDQITGFTAYPWSSVNKPSKQGDILIQGKWARRINVRLNKCFGLDGSFSYFSTKKLLKRIKELNPDFIHLHNVHGNYVNIPMLFEFIKRNNIPVIWTLHDCWPFTGMCPYFTIAQCTRWKTGCHDCPQFSNFYKYTVRKIWNRKKETLANVGNMTFVTPSQWLADLASKSFLREYPVKVINNGIDLSVFKPTKSNFREQFNIADKKYIVLGVASPWGRRKGFDVFLELEKTLDDRFQIVLVGTDDEIDKLLPDSVISIHRTNNQQALAEIYSAADVFANPTREENFPTVNIEAIACGTPVVTFDTGGSPEILNEKCGLVVPYNNTNAMKDAIKNICENRMFSEENCVHRANQFDYNQKFHEYIELYKQIIEIRGKI